MINKKIAEETAKLLLKIKAVSLSLEKPFVFTSGILSPIYTDNRLIISYPEIRKKIVDFYIKIIKERIGLKNINLISGTASAAIPFAAFISQKLNLPMVYVRSDKKKHGKGKLVEGKIEKGQKVLIVEDLVSTGGSLIHNLKAVRKLGGIVNYGICIVTYMMKKAESNFKKNRIKVFSLTNFNQIVSVAEKTGYIKKSEKDLVLSWAKNPRKWVGNK